MPSSLLDLASNGETKPAPSDPLLDQFCIDDFDSVDYLDDILPSLTLASQQTLPTKNNRLPHLQEISSDVQSLVSRLNTFNIKTSNALTQVTDEILRSGSRLAYEVEIFRGDVNSLYTAITDTLYEDITKLIKTPQDLPDQPKEQSNNALKTPSAAAHIQEPSFLTQLRTLQTARTNLDATIRTFGTALTWPSAPSDTMTSNLVSVSAPEFGLEAAAQSTQNDQARQSFKRLRKEIADLLDSDGGGYIGLEAAQKKADELRDLAEVWKGTLEEKARHRFVDSLAKMVEDRKRILDAKEQRAGGRPRGVSTGQRSDSVPVRGGSESRDGAGADTRAGGLLRKMRELRDEIYLD